MTHGKQKRILILGATEHSKHVIDTARRMGVYTVVTDYVKDNAAKKYADKAYDISTLDVPALIEICNNERIDGVIAGYVDINLLPYYKLCKAMGYYYYCDDRMLDLTMNKKNFKEMCRRFDIAVPLDINIKKPENISYPIIMKPADSYSSKGISVVNNITELNPAISLAYENSSCKEIVAEEFISAPDIYLYFTVQNGNVMLSAMADRVLRAETGHAPQPEGYRFPSGYINLYMSSTHKKIQKMIEYVGLKNGTFFLQGFVKEGEILFFEMGLRLSGGGGYIHINNQSAFSQLEMYIQYAITGEFGSYDIQKINNPYFVKPAYTLVVLLKKGKIGKVEGVERIKADSSYIDMIQLKNEGDELLALGTLNQVFARIYLSADTWEELYKSIEFIKATLKVNDINGDTMLYYDKTTVKNDNMSISEE